MNDRIAALWQKALAARNNATDEDVRLYVGSLKFKDQFYQGPSITQEEWQRILHWQENNPPPPAMSQGQFDDRVSTEFSAERAKQIFSLARPAIGLWPQRQPISDDPLASRHGGEVFAPPGWSWPVSGEEAQCFLAQINCGDFAGLPGAELLPRDGLLTFFGDVELVSGCFPESDGNLNTVCHFPVHGLMPAKPPASLSDEYLREYSTATPLLFRPFIDLPDTSSRVFEELGLSREEAERYYKLHWDLSHAAFLRTSRIIAIWIANFSAGLIWCSTISTRHQQAQARIGY